MTLMTKSIRGNPAKIAKKRLKKKIRNWYKNKRWHEDRIAERFHREIDEAYQQVIERDNT